MAALKNVALFFKKNLYLILLILGLYLFYRLLFKVGIDVFLENLQYAEKSNILTAVLVYFFILLIGLFRWIFLIKMNYPESSIGSLSEVYVLNLFVSNLTPARSGDVMLPFMLEGKLSIPKSYSSLVVLLERSGDLIALIIFFLFSFFLWKGENIIDLDFSAILPGAYLSMVVVFGLFFVTFLVAWLLGFLRRAWVVILNVFELSKKIGYSAAFFAFFLSFLTWFFHFVKEYLMASAFIDITFGQNMLCQSFSVLAALISFVPGGIGVGAVSYAFLAKQMGLDWAGAASSVMFGTVLFTLIRMSLAVFFNRSLFLMKKHRAL